MNKPYRSWFPRSQGLLLDLNELTTINGSESFNNRVCISTMKQFEKLTNTLCRTLMALLMLVFTLASHAAVESITYITTDHLGSPIMATDQSGAVLWREDYLPYGVQLVQEDEDSSVGFTGHLDEKTLDVTYMQGRWYHPEVGRFLAIDPVGFVEGNPMSFNRYAYANNNPYKYVDPDGKKVEIGIYWDLTHTATIITPDNPNELLAIRPDLEKALENGSFVLDAAEATHDGSKNSSLAGKLYARPIDYTDESRLKYRKIVPTPSYRNDSNNELSGDTQHILQLLDSYDKYTNLAPESLPNYNWKGSGRDGSGTSLSNPGGFNSNNWTTWLHSDATGKPAPGWYPVAPGYGKSLPLKTK